ncbi:hypothetical protein [Desulfoluna spongiiphila]|uniref:Uncharacterized protein n=1 Tax=Desulfoluna spongiiphila TaxID=419481 RepID=A0A1G5G3Z6_9BACT|nr:hypothetical protein [Desulfoluna spongiiphila]SCY46293.1 hypothetical protein SAMN05216233_109207 [Desulfoluna spongiiphila]
MNQDIRLSIAFNNHRKRRRLARLLGFGAEVYLIDLWLKVAVDRPSGHLEGWDEEDIADACGWMEDPKKLVAALVETQWLEKDTEGEYSIHDWCEHQPWACSAEDRADKARFSKLAQVNRAKYDELKENGVNAISKEEYRKVLEPSRVMGTLLGDRQPAASDSPAVASVSPAPAPTPSPTPSPSPNVKQKPLPPAGGAGEEPSQQAKAKSEFSGRPTKAYHPTFETFWAEYPARRGRKGNKRKAFDAWWKSMRHKRNNPDQIIADIIRLRDTYGEFPPDAVTWINGQRWEDEVHPCPPPKPAMRQTGRLQGSELLAHNTRVAAEFLGAPC